MKLDVITLDNKKAGSVDLNDAVFAAPLRGDLMARTVRWQLAKQRAGTHKVKGRSEIAARKGKPFRQKGTGRARQGTTVATQMRGGGVVFGPVVRSHAIGLPKKVRKAALRSALSARAAAGNLVVLDNAELATPKTKDLTKKVQALGWQNVLLIDGDSVNENLRLASKNLVGFDVLVEAGANVYDILRRDVLVLTKDGAEKLAERLK